MTDRPTERPRTKTAVRKMGLNELDGLAMELGIKSPYLSKKRDLVELVWARITQMGSTCEHEWVDRLQLGYAGDGKVCLVCGSFPSPDPVPSLSAAEREGRELSDGQLRALIHAAGFVLTRTSENDYLYYRDQLRSAMALLDAELADRGVA